MPGSGHGSVLALICVALAAGCGGRAHVRMSLTPAVTLMDAPVHLSISGLAAHERFAVRDGDRSVHLRADGGGRVDVRGDASLRLLWLLDPRGAGRMTLAIPGAHATITRLARAPGVRIRLLRPAHGGLYADYYAPTHAGTSPGILVFGGSEGGLSSFPRAVAGLYASHGYPALALGYFALPGLPPDLHRVPLEYFAKALRWLARQPGVDPAKLVVEGVSRGSEAAQLVGIHYPRLVHAVIAMVPGSGSSCGIPAFRGNLAVHCIGAAWMFRGRPVPYSLRGPATPYPFHDERIDGPVFLDCAGFDELWASCPMAQAIVARLEAHHFRHRVTFLYYPQAGHGVGPLLPSPPGSLPILEGASPDSNVDADANGWPRLLSFLRRLADS
ncbi:MAG TPA: acyl-CoA thioester hydrolase/BAAT C-terminal domain-containing protein [Gaiellaceae bacterium]|nr:acyl-CoA thioester hydrolase/BAAT C-terminal domain-containing protein [Gaiellaceae bacterium]